MNDAVHAAEAAQTAALALKHADTFLVFGAGGDIGAPSEGLFDNDTRVLSRLHLSLGGRRPERLSAALSQDNVFFSAHLTNRKLLARGVVATPEGVIHIERRRFLWQRRLYERIALTNFGQAAVRVPLEIGFGADFRDMFEVRGARRRARGTVTPPVVGSDRVVLAYTGLDGVWRRSVVAFAPAPARLDQGEARFAVDLAPNATAVVHLEVGPGEATPSEARFRAGAAAARRAMRRVRRRGARLSSGTPLFAAWLDRSAADLALLTTELDTGPYPYAGIPWFSTTFGRDAIITALQTLWLDPDLARGVLRFLAHNQAQEHSRFRDAAPGKIVHEMRKGEMTAQDELPFARYYGGVDTTPLFVVLAGAHAERTGDFGLVEELWPALVAAMGWIEGEGDSNGDGLLDYARGEASGLANQGWKDSSDSVFHADGTLAEGPIALVEVQGYVFAASRTMAALAARRGDAAAAAHWAARAEAVRAAVEARFWMEDLGCYALAIDGAGAPCRVRASNAGQLLWSGLPAPERARRVIGQLGTAGFDTGWGVRTVAREAARFNPMSYHNGSVWPHDTALCAAGAARYGGRELALRLLQRMFEAAVRFGMRLPELFCGFARAPGEPPIAYPVACLPQAWAAGSAFMLLQSALGLAVDGARGEIRVDRPALPHGVNLLRVRGLRVGNATSTLIFRRMGERVACSAEEGPVRIVRTDQE